MAKRRPGLSIRSFREGDEEALARLFNSYTAGFFGPIRVSPRSWRSQFRQQDWCAPSLTDDRDCGRVAESQGRIVGYAVTDYQPLWMEDGAVLQELCLVEEDGAEAVAQALIEDAETRALARGKGFLVLSLSPDDSLAATVREGLGYRTRDDGGAFMARITDLPGALAGMLAELHHRLTASPRAGWRGLVTIASGEQVCALVIGGNRVRIGEARGEPEIAVSVSAEALPLLLLGRETIGELYAQDQVAIASSDVVGALELLHVLFPPLPILLPRAQWW